MSLASWFEKNRILDGFPLDGIRGDGCLVGHAVAEYLSRILLGVKIQEGLSLELPGSKQWRQSCVLVDCLSHGVGVLRNGGDGHRISIVLFLLDIKVFDADGQCFFVKIHLALGLQLDFLFLGAVLLGNSLLYFLSGQMGTFSVNLCSESLRKWLKPDPRWTCSSLSEYLVSAMLRLICFSD